MKYSCRLCYYYTEDRTAYYQHKKTKKHQENVNKQPQLSNGYPTVIHLLSSEEESNEVTEKNMYMCIFCKSEYKHKSGLSKHKKYCSLKEIQNKTDEVKIDYIMKEKELIQKQLEEVKKEKEELKKEKEEEKKKLEEQLLYYRDVAYNKIENDSNMTNLNFLNKHFADAPALEGPKDLHKLFNADKTENPNVYYANLASELGSHHRLNILHKVISDFIVKDYCKEDKSKQSVWNSDSSRLNYIIKECIQKDKIWIMDKSGQSLLKKVINPIIEYIKPELEEATKRILSFSSKPNGITFMDMKDHQALLEIGNNIMNNTLQEDILKELTGHFNINQKLLLKDIKANNNEIGNKKNIKKINDIDGIGKIQENNLLEDKRIEEVDLYKKLIGYINKIDITLEKLRKEANKLDCIDYSEEEDDEKRNKKIKEIENKKKELKIQKKDLLKIKSNYDDLNKKIMEVQKEEENISNDTESEDELEKERQYKFIKIKRKKNEIKLTQVSIEKEINKIKLLV